MNTLKKITVAFITLLMIAPAFAQETITFGEEIEEKTQNSQQVRTLFKKDIRDGFYGSLSAGYASIDNRDGVTASARGCFIMDHHFAFGLAGTMFVNGLEDMNNLNNFESNNTTKKLIGGYGGFIFEPIIAPLSPVHISFPIMVGLGAATTFEDNYISDYYVEGQTFAVIEPMAELEVNFTRFMRLGAYVGYRLTSKIKLEGIDEQALNNYSMGLTIKFGMF